MTAANIDGGLTKTEQYLSRLAKRSFLSLWSHSNLFRDVGKELADLIVVCGEIVIIFSDKEVKCEINDDLTKGWLRWYNRAILKSVKQLRRAHGWILCHRDRIYLDAQCTSKYDLFDRVDQNLRIHLVTVANGASQSCKHHFGGGSGSLVVSPSEDPLNPTPFHVGNPAGEGAFVHVFDEAHLHIILQELDTIRDFSEYLEARERVVKNGKLHFAASEEDLLAVYLKDINENGEHDFVFESGVSLKENQFIAIEEGSYLNFQRATQYKRKKLADRKSYLWDRLIEKFAKNFRENTLAPIPENLGAKDGRHGGAELGLRYMALERRVQRRGHAEAIIGAFDVLEKSGGNRFFRAMIPENEAQGDTGFCILLLKRAMAPEGTSFEKYREFRAFSLSVYTENILERNRHLKRVIGIATEGELNGPKSEDLVYHEPPEWTPDAIKEAHDRAESIAAFTSAMTLNKYSALEYPETDDGLTGEFQAIPYSFVQPVPAAMMGGGGNRAERRKQMARVRRNLKRR